jgi:hypothetical protein
LTNVAFILGYAVCKIGTENSSSRTVPRIGDRQDTVDEGIYASVFKTRNWIEAILRRALVIANGRSFVDANAKERIE